jgi:mycothiol synthase
MRPARPGRRRGTPCAVYCANFVLPKLGTDDGERRMSTGSTSLHVARVPLTPDSHALHLALRAWPDHDRDAFLRAVTETQHATTSPLVLIEARRGAILAGAVIGQAMPGRAAMVWPPQLVEPQPLVTSSMLLDELCRELVDRDTVIAQSLLQSEALLDAEHLQAGGFSLLADLLYLYAPADVLPEKRPDTGFELAPATRGEERRLIDAIDSTYVGTHDCPSLDGSRDTADVLEGYRTIGVYRPELWMIVRKGGQDVGCLLLADHPEQRQVELVYMGLIPAIRGHGMGLQLVRMAQWLTRDAGRDRLVLAVDAANRPALQVYEAAQFHVFDRRSVYWKQLRARPAEALVTAKGT